MARKGAKERERAETDSRALRTETVRETAALCEVLNWTDDEAAKAEADLAHALASTLRLVAKLGKEPPPGTPASHGHQAFAGVIPLVRRLGQGLAEAMTPRGLGLPLPGLAWRLGSAVAKGVLGVTEDPHRSFAYEATEAVSLTCEEAATLTRVANMSPRTFALRSLSVDDDAPPLIQGDWSAQRAVSTVIWATRSLWAVLEGGVQLARCKVLWRGGPRRGQPCGRVYVVKGPAGQPRTHCTDRACAGRLKRYQREQKRRRDAVRTRK